MVLIQHVEMIVAPINTIRTLLVTNVRERVLIVMPVVVPQIRHIKTDLRPVSPPVLFPLVQLVIQQQIKTVVQLAVQMVGT
jgi:hypothetical protein